MTTAPGFRRTRPACYTAYFTMSSIFSVPPLLFVTFREMYAISYTLLGKLVLTNFCTQLLIDLVFTFISRYFNVKKVVRTMPLITSLGLAVYARFGRSIAKTLLLGMAGAACCYLVASLSGSALLAFLACILTGLFTAMLWPGSLIMMEENIPGAGVAAYAVMAAGGDLGASIAPQLMGVTFDGVSASAWGARLTAVSALTADQSGMKAGMLISAVFPLLGAALLVYMIQYFKKQNNHAKL